ncbi:trimeric intracellular cation channel family protein [Rummeliibacillus sp. JY-2-4R]
MSWEILNIIGTLAFAISGALVGKEEEFDILGVMVLGFTTAFGGGLVRNLMIGIPVQNIWEQDNLFMIAFVIILITFILPNHWIYHWKKWVILFDAIGLGAFAIQGANWAVAMHSPLISVIIAATLTGAGGGMIRDLFVGRKPLIFRKEIYALWASLAGLVIGLNWIKGSDATFGLLMAIVVCRLLSVYYHWNLPRPIHNKKTNS